MVLPLLLGLGLPALAASSAAPNFLGDYGWGAWPRRNGCVGYWSRLFHTDGRSGRGNTNRAYIFPWG